MSAHIEVVHADAGDWMTQAAADSVDALVTDPPYGLTDLDEAKTRTALSAWLGDDPWFIPGGRGLAGHGWDSFVPPPGLWAQALRILKPGAFAFVFASARTLDLMGMSCRLAGFEVRDTIEWINAQKMPKSPLIADGPNAGWGLNLKVAHEPILVLRKPSKLGAAANLDTWGTGALRLDASRTPSATGLGRWPTDVAFGHAADCDQTCSPDCPVAELDAQSGITASGANPTFARAGTRCRCRAPFDNAIEYRLGAPTPGERRGSSRHFGTSRPPPPANALPPAA